MNYFVDPRTGLPSSSSSSTGDAHCVSNHDDGDDDQEMMDCQSLSSTEAEGEAIHRTRARTASHGAESAQQAQQYQRPEPERGVKKTASLRRGGAVYDQLLQSAVMASIESRKDEQGQGGSVMDDDVVASFSQSFSPTSPIGRGAGRTMLTTHFFRGNDSASMDDTSKMSPGKKKRTGGHVSDFQGPAGFGTPPRSKSQKRVIPSAGVAVQAIPAPFHPGSLPNDHHQQAFHG